MVGTILQMLGHDVSEDRLQEIIAEVDADGKLKFIPNYACVAVLKLSERVPDYNNIFLVVCSTCTNTNPIGFVYDCRNS